VFSYQEKGVGFKGCLVRGERREGEKRGSVVLKAPYISGGEGTPMLVLGPWCSPGSGGGGGGGGGGPPFTERKGKILSLFPTGKKERGRTVILRNSFYSPGEP